jgi:hypothetical protein
MKIQVRLEGIRPLMFDRYSGDNNTQLAPEDKMYLDDKQGLMLPAVNLYSLLCAGGSDSVTNKFFGKPGKNIALGIKSYTSIEPFEIPIEDDSGQIIFSEFGQRIYVAHHVARVPKGKLLVPQSKQRPVLSLPWRLAFTVEYIQNNLCTLDNLRQAFDKGGVIGLGTFRPFFGRYELTGFDEIE